MMTKLILHEWVLSRCYSELLCNSNINFVDFIQHSFTSVQHFLFLLLNIIFLQEP